MPVTGGHDPGTSHHGLQEKRLALDIAKRVRTHLKAAGFAVVMTRETDRFIPLRSRAALANRLPADLLVSIHLNANHNRRVAGAEVYYPRESVISPSASWPPSIIHQEIGIPLPQVKQVLWDLVLQRKRSQSRRLAVTICRALERNLQVNCKGKSARFAVLREARMPAVLVEVGYVSNLSEARRLGSAEYRQAAAQSISQGIVSYVRDVGAQHI